MKVGSKNTLAKHWEGGKGSCFRHSGRKHLPSRSGTKAHAWIFTNGQLVALDAYARLWAFVFSPSPPQLCPTIGIRPALRPGPHFFSFFYLRYGGIAGTRRKAQTSRRPFEFCFFKKRFQSEPENTCSFLLCHARPHGASELCMIVSPVTTGELTQLPPFLAQVHASKATGQV